MIGLPLRTYTNPLSQILPQLTLLFAIPLPPTAVSPLLTNWAHLGKCSPWKKRKEAVTKARLSHKTVKKQSERLSNTKQREIPDSTTLHLLLHQCWHSLLPSMNGPNPLRTLTLWRFWPPHLWMTHLQIRQSLMKERGSGWKIW